MVKAVKEPKVTLNVKVDSDLKREAAKAFEDMGMTTSVAINMFLKKVVSAGELPFTPSVNSATLEAIREYEEGEVESYDTVDETFKALDND